MKSRRIIITLKNEFKKLILFWRKSTVVCICDTVESFVFIQERPTNNYVRVKFKKMPIPSISNEIIKSKQMTLRSQCCCPDACNSKPIPSKGLSNGSVILIL